jgi:LysM repeat protein
LIRLKTAVAALAIALGVTTLQTNVAVAAEVTKPTEYTVVAGDYLDKIATEHGTTWRKLFNKNTAIKHQDLIFVGEKILIPAKDEIVPERHVEPIVEAPVAEPVQVPTPAPQPAPEAPATVAEVVVPEPAPAPAPAPQPVAVSGCGDNDSANYIYRHESGCNTSAMNAGGCYGIGQDCNGIVSARCGADYACQNEYFTNYVNNRYGGWDGAYAFWLNNSWY